MQRDRYRCSYRYTCSYRYRCNYRYRYSCSYSTEYLQLRPSGAFNCSALNLPLAFDC